MVTVFSSFPDKPASFWPGGSCRSSRWKKNSIFGAICVAMTHFAWQTCFGQALEANRQRCPKQCRVASAKLIVCNFQRMARILHSGGSKCPCDCLWDHKIWQASRHMPFEHSLLCVFQSAIDFPKVEYPCFWQPWWPFTCSPGWPDCSRGAS